MTRRKKACALITSLDATGVQATDPITYKGKPAFKTAFGGCLSAIAYVTILTISVVMFRRLFSDYEFNASAMSTYIGSN